MSRLTKRFKTMVAMVLLAGVCALVGCFGTTPPPQKCCDKKCTCCECGDQKCNCCTACPGKCCQK